MRVVDSGVVIAAFASWHESHDVAHRELVARPQIAAHSLVEVFSVLTRLPAPHRVRPEFAAEFLVAAFDDEPLTLDGPEHVRLVTRKLPAASLSGGATYDALIAETVRCAKGVLVTLDRRALATYDRVGCEAVLLSAA